MNVFDIMSTNPITIGEGKSLKYALELMRENNIRHLPVLKAGKASGILSERDIRFLEGYERVDLEELSVSDAFTDDLYSVSPDESVKSASKLMFENKIGSLLVKKDQDLVGIITWIDILKYVSNNWVSSSAVF